MADIKIRGGKELAKRLNKEIPTRRIIFKVGNLIETKAKENLRKVVYSRPVSWTRTGKLQQSIAFSLQSDTKGKVTVGAVYGKFLEFGTKPYTITPRRRKFLRFKVGGEWVFARKARHPGIKKRPFFMPAVKEVSKNADKIAIREINK